MRRARSRVDTPRAHVGLPALSTRCTAPDVSVRPRECRFVIAVRNIRPRWRRERGEPAKRDYISGICGVARRLLSSDAMTRSFHRPVRLIHRRPRREPRPSTVSFTCFRLVAIEDREPGEAPYVTIEVMEPTNAMRDLVMEPRTFCATR
jgi:hypothetical protein